MRHIKFLIFAAALAVSAQQRNTVINGQLTVTPGPINGPLRDHVSVIDYGADPTGVLSNFGTAAAAAIAALPAGGGTVLVPQGSYVSTAAVSVGSNTTIACQDGASITFTGATDGFDFTNDKYSGIAGCKLIAGNAASAKALAFSGGGDDFARDIVFAATNPPTTVWAYGYWLHTAQGNTFWGGQVQATTRAIHIEATSNANSWHGVDITENVAATVYVESLGTGGTSGNNSFHGGIVEGAASTALVQIRGSDELKSFGVHYENAGVAAVCVSAELGGFLVSEGDFFGCTTTLSAGTLVGGTRKNVVRDGFGGVITLGQYSDNTWIENYQCTVSPCYTDASANQTNVIVGTLNVGVFGWNQGEVFPAGMPAPQFQNGAVVSGAPLATGGFETAIRTATIANDFSTLNDSTVVCDATSNAVNEYLPGSPGAGAWFALKKIDSSAHVCLLIGNGKNIEGSTTYSLSAQYKYVNVRYDGTQWWIYGAN